MHLADLLKKKNNGAALLVECLEKQGVEFIFGIPGAKIDAVFDALVDSSIKLILCRHEQNAAFMAAAYGRLTGKPGVVLVTSGPGVSNLATGLLTATTEGDPIIAIGGNVSRNMRLKASHQNTDNIKLMEAVTKARMEVAVVESIPEIVANAFRIAAAPHSGAVFISLPQDIGHELTTLKAPDAIPQTLFGSANTDEIARVAEKINQAKNPVLLLGQESSRPDNCAAIRAFIAKTHIATISTYQAAGVVSRELLPYFVGRIGLFKNQPGDILLNQSDLVICVGFNPIEYDPEIWNSDASKHIIHVNYDTAEIRSAYRPEIELPGDVAITINQLASKTTYQSNVTNQHLYQNMLDAVTAGNDHQSMPIHPLRFIHDLRNALEDNAIVVADVGSNYMWMARYFLSFEPHHLLFSNGQQTLGVALPWAMATRLVHPSLPIVSVSGDGGFLFSAMELETAVRENLHFVHFVWVDGSYDMVKEQQLTKYHRPSAVQLGAVNIKQFAESFGAKGYKVENTDQLLPIIQQALADKGPVLVEVPIDYSDNPALFETTSGTMGD